MAEVIVDDAGGWRYWTVVADVAEATAVEPVTWENIGPCRWAALDELADLQLHPGLADVLREIVVAQP